MVTRNGRTTSENAGSAPYRKRSKALLTKLRRDLWSLRSQTASIALLIVSGVSLLVATWSAYGSLSDARNLYYQQFRFADVFSEYKNAPPAVIEKIASLPGVDRVEARAAADGLVSVVSDKEPAVARFLSAPSPSDSALNKIFLRKGRLPTAANQTVGNQAYGNQTVGNQTVGNQTVGNQTVGNPTHNNPTSGSEVEVVAHEGFASAHQLSLQQVIELTIEGQKIRARVVGIGISPEFIYALSPFAPLPDDLRFGVFWMGDPDLRRLKKLGTSTNSLSLTLRHHQDRDAVISAIDLILAPYGSHGAYGRDRQLSNMFVEDEIAEQRASAVFIPTIFLTIATFLIHVVASRLISLHRSQIAILKSLGFTRFDVARHYLALLILMSFAGTLPGIAVGAFLGRWMSNTYEAYFRFPSLDFTLSLGAAAIGLCAGLLPGLLGGWMGVRTAFRLPPAEAMKPAQPSLFRIHSLDQWRFFAERKAHVKMVIRNLFSRPIRFSLVVLSLSSATAVLIAAGAWSDMMSYLLDTHFNRLLREDLSVRFVHPRSLNALQELSHLPGVIAVEGYRSTSVRVRHQNRKRELELIGWPQSASMRQRLDKNLKITPLAQNGILLSQFFAKSWGLHAGDQINIELLEGSSKINAATVAGFTDDLVGLSASLEIERLWEILNETTSYNLVTITADVRQIDRLYLKLQSYPEVYSINLKSALFRGFQATFGRVIASVTNILMVASLLIAFGIIYNSVRVSFSERSWELASLRVLGFSRSRVSELLWMEVGIQVGFSLLPGCLLGLGLTHLSISLIHTETFGFPVVIEPSTYARGLLTVLIAFIASAKAVDVLIRRLNPAEALKARD